MLNRLTVRGFKSLADAAVELPRFAVLFGPNATGKSNLLDAIQVLSWIARRTTLDEEIVSALASSGEDAVFQGLVLRGFLDE